MPVAQLELPTGETLEIVYLRKLPDLGDLIYLHSVRTGRVTEPVEKLYKTMAPFHAGRLAQSVTPSFDAIVSPPSERADAEVYRNALIGKPGALDLTDRFSRKGNVKASTASSIQEVVDEFDYAAQGDESEINSLLIVDESVASGKTVAAVLEHLRRAGLPGDCKIMVAAPAWLKQ